MPEINTVTMIGAVIAAVASSLNLWWQFWDRRDRYFVRWGALEPSDVPGFQFFVVNTGKNDLTLLDYGFVFKNGYFESLPRSAFREFEETRDHDLQLASNPLRPHQPQEIGGMVGLIEAAYAISATQSRPRLAFAPRVPLWRRWKLRIRVFILGDRARRAQPPAL